MGKNLRRRVVELPRQPTLRLNDARAVHKLLWPRFVGLDREHLWRVDLDARGGLLGAELVSIGTVDQTLAHPREIFGPALSRGASRIVLAHNHPSGCIEPSPQDIESIRRFRFCGLILGVDVADELIVHDGDYWSARESGFLEGARRWKPRGR